MKKLLALAILNGGCLLAQNAIAGMSMIEYDEQYHKLFTTPSGNIICGGDPKDGGANVVTCYAFKVSSQPKNCRGTQGLEFMLTRTGTGKIGCGYEFEPDEIYGEPTVIPYGKTISGNGWQCTSASTGLSCTNTANHGFKISRSAHSVH